MNKDACSWLWDEFEIRLSDIIRGETENHPSLMEGGLKRKIRDSAVGLNPKLAKMEEHFSKPLQIAFNDDRRDRGERENCHLGIQMIVQKQACQVIFLTNELKIMRDKSGFLKRMFDSYPIGVVWNSLDFILYLFLRHKRFPYEAAKDALRGINARMGGKTEDVMSRLGEYDTKLKRIDAARRGLTAMWETQ